MNATDVLDAYLDQNCKRSFQSSKSVLRGKPPRHGERTKTSSLSPKRVSACESLRKAAGPLSPANSCARRIKEANLATLTDRRSTQISKQHKVKETPHPFNNTAQRSASEPLASSARQQPSTFPEELKEAYKGWPKAAVKHGTSLPILSGAARDEHAIFSITFYCLYVPPPVLKLSPWPP